MSFGIKINYLNIRGTTQIVGKFAHIDQSFICQIIQHFSYLAEHFTDLLKSPAKEGISYH